MQQNEKVAEGLDNQSLSLDFLLCLIFVPRPLIFNKSTKKMLWEVVNSLAKTILFYLYFRSILMLSHLFLNYCILSDLYFILILPDGENRATILIVLLLF